MKAIVWPCFNVAGVIPLVIENPAPLMELEMIVAAALPVDVTVTDLVTAFPTRTSPYASDDVLSVNDGADDFEPFNWKATVFDDPFAVAETERVCAELTAATFAINEALIALAGIATFAGTFTALLLEARPTITAVGNAVVSDTVQVVLPDPMKEVFAQVRALSSAARIPPDGGIRASENVFTTAPWVALMIPAWFDATDEIATVN